MPRNVGRPSEQVIILLHEIGERLKLQGDNRFRAQAYTGRRTACVLSPDL